MTVEIEFIIIKKITWIVKQSDLRIISLFVWNYEMEIAFFELS